MPLSTLLANPQASLNQCLDLKSPKKHQPTSRFGLYSIGLASFNGTQGTRPLGELDRAFYPLKQLGSSLLAILLILMILGSFFQLSGVFTVAFGCGYWFRICSFLYYAVVQILCGFFQSTGWPAVVVVGLVLLLPGFFVFLIGMVLYLFLVVSPELIHLFRPSEIELNPIEGSDPVEAEHLGLLQFKDSKSLEDAKPLIWRKSILWLQSGS